MKPFAWNPSGGLTYHLQGHFRRNHDWKSYRDHLESWLRTLPIEGNDLVLVGPSGGYTFPTEFYLRFEKKVFFEPDFWSRFFFFKIHRSAELRSLEWKRTDFFRELETLNWDREAFLRSHGLSSSTVFVFANFLGQLEFLRSDYGEVLSLLRGFLEGSEWISVHDRLASSLELRGNDFWCPTSREVDPQRLAERTFRSAAAPGEVEEHDLSAFWKKGEVSGSWFYSPWRLRPGWTHLMEGVHVSSSR